MSIFSKLFGKTEPKTVTAHILDPADGYVIAEWVIGRDVFPPKNVDIKNENVDIKNVKELYVVNGRENGKVTSTVCTKQMWLAAKSAYAGIEEVGAKAEERTRQMFAMHDERVRSKEQQDS